MCMKCTDRGVPYQNGPSPLSSPEWWPLSYSKTTINRKSTSPPSLIRTAQVVMRYRSNLRPGW
jgi:hypothetical protein